ncbi:hypothetical protein [Deinococcus frigens]|uniref:hypothetical protein n=1 Tax=Deinococcus frigens TaxID=249403 RepID=UPI0039F10CFE
MTFPDSPGWERFAVVMQVQLLSKTYGNSRITAVDLNGEDLDTDKLIVYPLNQEQDILRQQPHGKR